MNYPCLLIKKIIEISPSKYNPRTISDESMGRLTKSLAEFGNIQPITWNARTGNVVGGHQRLKVYQAMGKTEVEVWAVDLSEQKEKAANIALNKLSGEFDMPMLKDILEEIDTGDLDMEVTGFAMDEIAEMMESVHPIEEDEVPEVPVDAITKLGDLWLLGEHRVLCGDSTKVEDMTRLVNGQLMQLMVTDPPYNVDYEGNYIQSGKILKKKEKIWSGGIANDNRSDFAKWLSSVFSSCDSVLGQGAAIYVWHPSGEDGKHFWNAWPFDDWHFQVDLVWNKTSLIISRWDYKPQHEPCMYGWKGKNRSWIGPNNEPTVWDIKRQQGASGEARGHPTQKPTECMARPIRNHAGEFVFDPFLGSGTTLIAAEQLGRKCYGMEISPNYCDVIVKRWENLTNKKATLAK